MDNPKLINFFTFLEILKHIIFQKNKFYNK